MQSWMEPRTARAVQTRVGGLSSVVELGQAHSTLDGVLNDSNGSISFAIAPSISASSAQGIIFPHTRSHAARAEGKLITTAEYIAVDAPSALWC